MGNVNQTKSIDKVKAIIEQELPSAHQFITHISDYYLGYMELTIEYKEQNSQLLGPIAQSILQLVQVNELLTIQAIAKLLCADELVVWQALDELKHRYDILVNEQTIRIGQQLEYVETTISETIICQPQMLKKVDIIPDYSIDEQHIYLEPIVLQEQDVYKLFPHVKSDTITNWYMRKVAGIAVYKVVIYDKQQQLQTEMIYNADGIQLHVLEQIPVQLSEEFMIHYLPTTINRLDNVLAALPSNRRTYIAINEPVTAAILSYMERLVAPAVVLIGLDVPSQQVQQLHVIEKQSLGLLTILRANHDLQLLIYQEQCIVNRFTAEEMATYEEQELISFSAAKIEAIISQLASSSNNEEAMKAFIYLVNQKAQEEQLFAIVQRLASNSTSDLLMQRGKILENNGYKKLAERVYELGITAYAQEVNHE